MALDISLSELECSVCLSTLRDPYITSCGHTACHECLARHQAVKLTCPVCSTYLSRDQVFPNFLLSQVRPSADELSACVSSD